MTSKEAVEKINTLLQDSEGCSPKDLQVLGILKNKKRVNFSVIERVENVDTYNETESEKENPLNEKEFKLLKEWMEMTNKDEQPTYEELTALCRKQEEYIKELEEKLKTPSDTEECSEKIAEPGYDELVRERGDLYHQLSVLTNENNALRWSLTMSHQVMNDWKNRSEKWEEDYYEEHQRAEKLYDKLNKK